MDQRVNHWQRDLREGYYQLESGSSLKLGRDPESCFLFAGVCSIFPHLFVISYKLLYDFCTRLDHIGISVFEEFDTPSVRLGLPGQCFIVGITFIP